MSTFSNSIPQNGNGKPPVSDSSYRRHIERARSSSTYFQFSRDYILVMSRQTALFYQDLLNIASMPGTVKKEIDGHEFFMCSEAYLHDRGLRWTDDEQQYHFAILQGKITVDKKKAYQPKRHFIHLRRDKGTKIRWVWIDLRKIEEAIDLALDGNSPTGFPVVPPTGFPVVPPTGFPVVIKKEGIKEGGGMAPQNGTHFSPGRVPIPKQEHLDAASKLRESLRNHNRQVSVWNLKGWAEHLRLLKEQDKQDYTEVLDWYCLHCSREEEDLLGLPDIPNAKAFRARFSWIEKSMRKSRRSNLDQRRWEKEGW